jgi:hypothetical protein
MCIIFYGLRYVFLTTARNVKRVEAISMRIIRFMRGTVRAEEIFPKKLRSDFLEQVGK